MTSKNLFFKRMKQDLEQRIWLPIVFFILAFLVMEISLISLMEQWHEEWNYVEIAREYLMETFFAPFDGFIVLTIGMAVVSAMSGFWYMHSAKKLDVYHSLPVKRENLFLQQYVYGLLHYVIPMVLHVIICLSICGINGFLNGAVAKQAFGFALGQLVIYLACYSVVVLAVCLTGNIVVSVLGSAVLLGYSVILEVLKEEMMDKFFVTYCDINDVNRAEVSIPAFTPLHLLVNWVKDMDDTIQFVYTDYMGYFVKFLIIAVIFTVVALFLYKKRPTEAAEKSIAFTFAEPIIKTIVVVPVSIISGYIFSGILFNDHELAWFVFGCGFGFLISCPAMEIIFRKDIKAVFAHPMQLIFNGACVIGVIVILQFDVFGYDSYVPNADDVESCAVITSDFNGITGTYGSSLTYRRDNMKIMDNASVRALLEYATEYARPAWREAKVDGRPAGGHHNRQMLVKYNLKNGKAIYRNLVIDLADEQVMQWLGDMYNDEEYKQGVYPVLTEWEETNYVGIFLDYAYGEEGFPLSEEKMQKFVETYRKELLALTFDEILTTEPVANLTFAITNEEEEQQNQVVETYTVVEETVEYNYGVTNFTYDRGESGYCIYPSFTETLALLEEYGATIAQELPVENVLRITIEDWSREADDHDGRLTKIVELEYQATEDADKIAQLCPKLLNLNLGREFETGEEYEPHLQIEITYLYNDKELVKSMRILRGEMPDFLQEDLEVAAQGIM